MRVGGTPPRGQGYDTYVGRVARGAGMSSMGQGVGRLLGYAAQVALARMFGPAQLGFYVIGVTVVKIVNTLSQFGMDNGVVRYVAHYGAEQDTARMRGIILQALGITFGISVLLSGAMFFGAGLLADLVDKEFLETMLKVFSASVPFLTLMSMALWATQGFQTVKYSTYVQQVLQPVLNLVLVLVFYLLGAEILGAVASYAVSMAVGSALALYYLRKVFPQFLDRGTPARFESRALFSVSGPMTIAGFSSHANSWTAIGALTVFSTTSSVGIFNVAFRTAALSTLVLVAFNGIFAPMASSLHKQGQLDDLGRLYKDVSRWTFTGALAIFALTVLLSRDVMAVFGEEFVAAWPVVVVMAAAQLFNSSVGPTGRMLAMTGHQGIVMVATLSATAAGLALSVALVPSFGALGAAFATAGGIALTNLITLSGIRRALGFWPYDCRYVKPISAGLLASAGLLVASFVLPLPVGLPSLFALGPLFVLLFATALLAFGLSPSDRQLLVSFWTAVLGKTVRRHDR